MALRVIDLFCGLGGFSQAFRDSGHNVIGLDIIPPADLIVDIRQYQGERGSFDVVLAAPPCDEFARESMPWCRTGKEPSVDLVRETLRIVNEIKPRVWLMENVRGAEKYITPLAPPMFRIGWRLFWGEFPDFYAPPETRTKESMSSSAKRERAKIGYPISLAVCLAAEKHCQ